MKKLMLILGGLLVAIGVIAGGLTGGGQVVAVTTVPTTISSLDVDVVNIHNVTGSDILWVLFNSSGTAVSNAAVAGTAVPILAGQTRSFDTRSKKQVLGSISSIALVTTNATATAYVDWF